MEITNGITMLIEELQDLVKTLPEDMFDEVLDLVQGIIDLIQD